MIIINIIILYFRHVTSIGDFPLNGYPAIIVGTNEVCLRRMSFSPNVGDTRRNVVFRSRVEVVVVPCDGRRDSLVLASRMKISGID